MTQHALLIHLLGIGLVTTGTLGTPALSTPAVGAGAGATDRAGVGVTSGPAVDGRSVELTLALRTPLSADRTVTDLLPAGVRYVQGSSRSMWGSTGAPEADPHVVVTPAGTVLVWSGLRAPAASPAPKGAGGSRTTGRTTTSKKAGASRLGTGAPHLSFAVRPVGAHPVTWSWSDRATTSPLPSSPAVAAARAATATGRNTARSRIDVGPLWAGETGRVVGPVSGSSPSATGAVDRPEELLEQATVETGTTTPAPTSTVDVYFPGVVEWAGCSVKGSCVRPSVETVRMATERGHRDLALLTVPASAARGAPRTFTVLGWHLRHLWANAIVDWSYRIEARATSPSRTENLVVASTRPGGAAGTTSQTLQTWPRAAVTVSPSPVHLRHPSGAGTALAAGPPISHVPVSGTSPTGSPSSPARRSVAGPDTTTASGRDPFTGGTSSTTQPSGTGVKKPTGSSTTGTSSTTSPSAKDPSDPSKTSTAGGSVLASTGAEVIDGTVGGGALIGVGAVIVAGTRPRRRAGSRRRIGNHYRSGRRYRSRRATTRTSA